MKDEAPFFGMANNQKPEKYPQDFVRSNDFPTQYKAHNDAASKVDHAKTMTQVLRAK